MEASARAWGVGDLEGRSAAKPCRLTVTFCAEACRLLALSYGLDFAVSPKAFSQQKESNVDG